MFGINLPPVTTTNNTGGLEDFETGNINKFNWALSGDANWAVTTEDAYSGNYSAQAGSINHGESTALELIVDCVQGNITFSRKVSSESGFDYLKFYINGVEKGKWSGDEDWAIETFPVNAGERTFTWGYSKDNSVSVGSDTDWIDNVVLPID